MKETAEKRECEGKRGPMHYSVRYLMIASLKIPSRFIFDPKLSRQHQHSTFIGNSGNAIATSQATILDKFDEMRRNNAREKGKKGKNIKQKISDVSRNDIQNKLIQTKALSVLKRRGCEREHTTEMCMGRAEHILSLSDIAVSQCDVCVYNIKMGHYMGHYIGHYMEKMKTNKTETCVRRIMWGGKRKSN